ncbi:MAG: xanthine dehydrogenase family protein molybdopterin-binding subunit [Burkholderiales bacterium]
MNAPAHPPVREGAPYVGQSIRRTEDERFLTGRAQYVGDFKLDGLLHAVIVRSPHAHARLLGIDRAKVMACPGVKAFFTYEDIAAYGAIIPVRLAPLAGVDRFLQEPLARDRVRYVGEPIGVIVAANRYLAEDALDAVEAEYEILEPVVNVEQALADESVLHPAPGTNTANRYVVSKGDADGAFAEAHYTRRELFRSHRHSAVMLETRGLVAAFDPTANKLTVWGATKVPFFNRRALAKMLKLQEHTIEMIELDVGGAFGVRGEFYPEDFLVPFAAMKLGAPVKWIEDRREHFLSSNHSREMECELEVAFAKDGTLLAMRGRIFGDLGAYIRTAGGVGNAKAAQFLPGPYRLENFSCEVVSLLTNKTPVGTYRAPGRYEANFFRERMFDLAAADLGMTPVDIRLRNLIAESEMPYSIGRICPYEGDNEYDTGDYASAFRRALEAIDYDTIARQSGKQIDGKYHGVGLCAFVESSGAGPSESARIVIRGSNLVEVFTGCTSMGQGHETVFAQIAADELSMPFETIKVFHGSTTFVDNGFGTYHSRAIVMGGSAIKVAAEKLIRRLIALAAERAGLDASLLLYRAGQVRRREGNELILTFDELVALARQGDTKAAAASVVNASFEVTKRTYTYGTHVAHVAVDPETGGVDVLRYVGVEDVGRAINPLLVDAQAIGGTVQGLGGTLLEEFIYDQHGQLVTGTLADYLLPTSCDFPRVESITLEEAPSKLNPLGVKGAGEGAIGCVGAAIGNAVSAALATLGVNVTRLPLSPNNLAKLIREARSTS